MEKLLVPTKVFMGNDVIKENSREFQIGKKAFIVTGKSSGEKSGALKDVCDVLFSLGIEYSIFDKVNNNPSIEEVYEGGMEAKKENADFIIGIGGGSPLDASKAIAVYAKNPVGDDFSLYDIYNDNFKNPPLPMIAVPTTAGTGSETTQYSILTLHKEKTKKSFASKSVFYKKAFLDGKYNLNIPLFIARNTYVDALCHLIEGYTNKKSTPDTDEVAEKGLAVMGKFKENMLSGEFTREDCTELLYGSMLAGTVIAHTGTTIVHSMGYPLTYYKNIPHGRANGMLLYEYMKRTYEQLPEKINKVLELLGYTSVLSLSEFLSTVLPGDEKFDLEEIKEWTQTTVKAKNATVCPFTADYDTELEIFKKSLEL